MTKNTRPLAAVIAPLLVGLSLVLGGLLLLSHTARANPGVLYAAPTAQGSGDCSRWADACTLQTALTQAVSGDEIWVKAGVHYPGAAGNREATFTLKNGVALYGGFAGTETGRDQRDWQVNKTILSGDIDQDDINFDGNYIAETWKDIVGNNAYHVVTGSSIDNTTILDGVIITAGRANGSSPHNKGGGMYNHWSSPTLANVTFSGNFALYEGGGMYNRESSPTLTNVTFSGNSGVGGGMCNWSYSSPTLTNVAFSGNAGRGMSNYYSSPTLINVTFSGNSSAGSGGGMFNYFSWPTLTNVTFSGNAANSGGGIYNYDSSPTLANVTFSGNAASEHGGGMYNQHSSPTLINITFSGNSANYGGGMYNRSSSSALALTNVIIWANSAKEGESIYNDDTAPAISYGNIQGCGASGPGWNHACGRDGGANIEADPLFVDAANGNLRLRPNSPCIDAGNTAALPASVTTDLDGNPRVSGAAVDMGAYEVQVPDVDPPTVVSITRTDPNPTIAPSVRFRVAFSEAVQNVDVGDFSLTTTGEITGASVTGVSGGGATHTVTVATGSGSGTLRLDIPTTATISDRAGNALSGLPYTGGEAYEVSEARRIFLPLVLRN